MTDAALPRLDARGSTAAEIVGGSRAGRYLVGAHSASS